jgi:Uma2 family endonuclease
LSLGETAEQVMGMPKLEEPVTTVEQLLALPDDGLRHELLDGEHVVTPAPAVTHQRAVRLLFLALGPSLSGRTDVELFSSPADVVLGPKTLVQPDLFVARRPPEGLRKWPDVGVPALAIEILSPGTAARDRGKKRVIYQREGVAEYWIVDLDARLVERWRPGEERPEILRDRVEWEGVTIELPAFFAAVWEDEARA